MREGPCGAAPRACLIWVRPLAAPMALEAIPQALWFFLPAFVANPSAVLWGGGRPMDFGRVARDGERLLGDGKTWRGLFGGTLSGAALGFLLALPFAILAPASSWSFGAPSSDPGPSLLVALGASAVLALGALLGDVVGAFIKRRRRMPRGAKAPGLDQYDFVVGGLLLSLLISGWSVPRFFSGDAWWGLLGIILITPALHRAVNILGYRMGKKHEPW